MSNIESGQTQKIDFALMDKVCWEFDVDFGYFTKEKQVNKAKSSKGGSVGVIGYNQGTINLFPENLIKQLKILIEDSKNKDAKIKELEALLKKK